MALFNVDEVLARLDGLIGAQLDAIIHHPSFRRMERTWRGLAYLVDRIDYRENIRLEIRQCTKEELLVDFDQAAEHVTRSALYSWLTESDDAPIAVALTDYERQVSSSDALWVYQCAAVAQAAHTVFLAGANEPLESYAEVRAEGRAKNVALCLPDSLLRPSYRTERAAGLWAGSQLALAERIAASFARYRHGGNCEGESTRFPGVLWVDIPHHQGAALRDAGFTVLSQSSESGRVVFKSVTSLRAMPLGTLLFMTRLAHYLTVIARQWDPPKAERDAELALSRWLWQFVADAEVVSSAVRARRPLRKAKLTIGERDGAYWFELGVRTHSGYEMPTLEGWIPNVTATQPQEPAGAQQAVSQPGPLNEKEKLTRLKAALPQAEESALRQAASAWAAASSRVQHLVAPIAHGVASQVGEDISYDERFEEIKYELEKLSSLSGETVDWNVVRVTAEELLEERSKDLRVACYWAITRCMDHQLEGVLDGVTLLDEITERYWDVMFPPTRRARARAGIAVFWSDQAGPRLLERRLYTTDAPMVMAIEVASRSLETRLAHGLGEQYRPITAFRDAVRRSAAGLRLVPTDP